MRHLPKISYLLIVALVVSSPFFLARAASTVLSSTPADIQAQINARTEQLQAVNRELQATQGQLTNIQGQKSSLQGQVQSLDTSIKQLNLNIQKDQLTGANLTDEINSLQAHLLDIDASIDDRKKAISATMQELQQHDDLPLVLVLLSGRSLAEGLADAKSLGDLRHQLNDDISSLNNLSEEYGATLESVSEKKTAVAVHQENLENHKAIVQDEKQSRAALLAETKNKEAIYQQKLKDLSAQQEALDNEISQIEAQLKAQLNPNLVPVEQEGLFSWPLESVRITQHFGEKSSLYRGKAHNGLDLAAAIGTPILAAANGVVVAVDNNDRSATSHYQYGKYILIKHANNLETLYAHMSRQVVSPGQTVKRGEIIGYSGKTGYATGPHLHFGVYYAPSVTLKSLPPAAGLVPVGVVLNAESYLPVH